MNERIRELAIQSGLPTALDYHQKRYENFAELIVKECIDAIYNIDDLGGYHFKAAKAVKEHFGIKA